MAPPPEIALITLAYEHGTLPPDGSADLLANAADAMVGPLAEHGSTLGRFIAWYVEVRTSAGTQKSLQFLDAIISDRLVAEMRVATADERALAGALRRVWRGHVVGKTIPVMVQVISATPYCGVALAATQLYNYCAHCGAIAAHATGACMDAEEGAGEHVGVARACSLG